MKFAARIMLGIGAVGAGCAGGRAIDERHCEYVRHQGMCEATVTLDPRESESPDEATTLVVRWEWQSVSEVPEVPDRVVTTHMTAREARALAESIDDLEKSPCVVEQAVSPAACVGIARIVDVEAQP